LSAVVGKFAEGVSSELELLIGFHYVAVGARCQCGECTLPHIPPSTLFDFTKSLKKTGKSQWNMPAFASAMPPSSGPQESACKTHPARHGDAIFSQRLLQSFSGVFVVDVFAYVEGWNPRTPKFSTGHRAWLWRSVIL
jgi:hypothetical protein